MWQQMIWLIKDTVAVFQYPLYHPIPSLLHHNLPVWDMSPAQFKEWKLIFLKLKNKILCIYHIQTLVLKYTCIMEWPNQLHWHTQYLTYLSIFVVSSFLCFLLKFSRFYFSHFLSSNIYLCMCMCHKVPNCPCCVSWLIYTICTNF